MTLNATKPLFRRAQTFLLKVFVRKKHVLSHPLYENLSSLRVSWNSLKNQQKL